MYSDSLMTPEGKCKLKWKLKNREQTYRIYWNVRQEFCLLFCFVGSGGYCLVVTHSVKCVLYRCTPEYY